jgi:hypothetical protein
MADPDRGTDDLSVLRLILECETIWGRGCVVGMQRRYIYILWTWHCRFLAVDLDVQPRSDLPGSGLAPANPCLCI